MNRYIHGTTSEILNLLPYTDFTLMSPLTMIEKYNIAPISGEIIGGGFDRIASDCNTCFGRVHINNYNDYGKEKVLRYTKTNKNHKDYLEDLKHQIDIAIKCGYSNINVIIIYMLRCRQLGHDIKSIVTDDFIMKSWSIYNTYALLLFMHKWIKPRYNFNEDPDKHDAIYTHLTLNNISNKLINSPDLYKIYQEYKDKPAELPEDIKLLLLSALELPKTSIIKTGILCKDKEITLENTQLFTFNDVPYTFDESRSSMYNVKYLAYRLPQNVSGYSINNLLEYYSKWEISGNLFDNFRDEIISLLESFQTKINLLNKIRNLNFVPQIKFDIPLFPLIIVSNDDSVMDLYGCEFRAKRGLKLGVDIDTLATDNEENKVILEKYLEKYNITCKVILFSEL